MQYPVAIQIGTDQSIMAIAADLKHCVASGTTYAEVMAKIKKQLEVMIAVMLFNGNEIPFASTIDEHIYNPEFSTASWCIIDVDLDESLGEMQKKNVSIPVELLRIIDSTVESSSQYRDRSHFLQMAAITELNNSQRFSTIKLNN
ncbi:type II toxin-antitoxin system HicB family antitoxin [Vibrio sp. Makdt]|uniref:type II toxin-antitoxin system HicB family antitoxin n=1 Tax=Vibrio sp. Makdt TaxID=2998828 RepID=UPI0022CD88DC|nr:type II toxin-antitoxin system HicB family antitoxin [Vibrio sp. Makdt]MDA0152182.1 type II toxin-antitoxin system HicB family antitoxin [Vibrio sp. Makdt]